MSTITATSADTTTYTLTSQLTAVKAHHPPVTTLGFSSNLEIGTVENSVIPGFGTNLFFAALSAQDLQAMTCLAGAALAQQGEATIQYQVIDTGSASVAKILAFGYDGKVVKD